MNTAPTYYLAQDGPLDTVTVECIADFSQSSEDVAILADDYPEMIYFEVTPPPTVEDVKDALSQNLEKVLDKVARMIVALGANAHWSHELNFSTTEQVANLAKRVGLPAAGSGRFEDVSQWREIADTAGIDYDEDGPW